MLARFSSILIITTMLLGQWLCLCSTLMAATPSGVEKSVPSCCAGMPAEVDASGSSAPSHEPRPDCRHCDGEAKGLFPSPNQIQPPSLPDFRPELFVGFDLLILDLAFPQPSAFPAPALDSPPPLQLSVLEQSSVCLE